MVSLLMWIQDRESTETDSGLVSVLDPNGPKKSDHNQDNTELFTSFITDKCIILDKAEKSGFESFKKKSFISEVVEVQADNPCGG